jgi:RimJ/RimL family protein N-acetyltransferase
MQLMTETIQTDAGPVTLRTTRREDGERLRALRIEAVTQHPTSFSSSPQEAAVEDWIGRAADGCGEGLTAIFVAEAAGELVAMTGILLSDKLKYPHSAFIWGVYTRAAWRGRGLSERLVNATVAWAAAKGRTIVRLAVCTQNAAAMRIYLRCGFSVYGVERAASVVEGVEYDELLMHRRMGGESR